MEYQLHPLCTFFPRMDEVSFAALVADIKANGLNHPITLLDGMILDGGNRYKACIEAGVVPRFVKYDGNDPVRFVLSENLERRHLDAGQRAAIVTTVTKWSEAHSHGGDRKSSAINSTWSKIEDRAKESGVSKATQRKADAVAKANPELAKKVAQGDVSLNEATKQVAPQLLGKKSEHKPEPQSEPEADYEPEDNPLAVFDELRARIDALEDENRVLLENNATDLQKELLSCKQRLANAENQNNHHKKLLARKSEEANQLYKAMTSIAHHVGVDHKLPVFRLCQSVVAAVRNTLKGAA